MSMTEYESPIVERHIPMDQPMGKLADALAKAQAEINNPAKTGQNPHFKSNYATLAVGIDAVRMALGKHGIAFVQTTAIRGEMMVLYTRLIHSSGEWIGSEWPVASYGKVSPQQMGSALTYARRYSLFSIVGIAGHDDDDDGEVASAPSNRSMVPPPPPPPPMGKRIPPKEWAVETQKLFRAAKTIEKLNDTHVKLLKTFAFNQIQLDEVEAMLMEESAKFEESENA